MVALDDMLHNFLEFHDSVPKKSGITSWKLAHSCRSGKDLQRSTSARDDRLITLAMLQNKNLSAFKVKNHHASGCARKREADQEILECNWSKYKKTYKWSKTYQAA